LLRPAIAKKPHPTENYCGAWRIFTDMLLISPVI
jgi:hypothetical protein